MSLARVQSFVCVYVLQNIRLLDLERCYVHQILVTWYYSKNGENEKSNSRTVRIFVVQVVVRVGRHDGRNAHL